MTIGSRACIAAAVDDGTVSADINSMQYGASYRHCLDLSGLISGRLSVYA